MRSSRDLDTHPPGFPPTLCQQKGGAGRASVEGGWLSLHMLGWGSYKQAWLRGPPLDEVFRMQLHVS